MSLITLIKKDLKIVISDRKALIILVAMPIILYTILSFALVGSFDSSDNQVWDIHVGIVKQYNLEDEVSQYMTLEDAEELENILFDVLDDEDLSFMTYEIIDYETGIEKLEANELASVIVLPEHYISNLGINMSPTFRKPMTVEVVRNPERQYSSDIVENLVSGIMNELTQVMTMNKVTYETLNHYDVNQEVIDNVLEVMRDQERTTVEVEMKPYKIEALKTVNSGQYYSTAMMAMFLLFGASYGAKFMLIEKRNFTLQRQTCAGISSAMIVFGKLALIFLIAVMQIALMILTSSLGFGVYWGNPIEVIIITIITAIAITGFGTLLASISLKAGDFKALNLMESGIFQVLALFGGSYFPLFLMPDWFKWISRALLNGAALEAYQKVMMDAPLTDMMPSVISLLLNGLGFLVIGMVIIYRQPKNTLIPVKEEVVL